MPATVKTISAAYSWTDPVHIIGDFNLYAVSSTVATGNFQTKAGSPL